MKKLLSLLSLFTVLVLVLTACGDDETEVVDNGEQLEVMVTLFAQYDFARQIGGEYVNVSRLAPPGVDIHSFEPTPQDMIAINNSDLFIYTGVEMEPWVYRILESLDSDDLTILDVSHGVQMLEWYGAHDHDHDHEHENDDHNHDHEHENDDHNHDHGHENDDHNHDHGHENDDHNHDHEHENDDHNHDHEHENDDHNHDHEHENDDHNHDHEHENDDHNHDHEHENDDHNHDHSHDYDPHIWTSPINAIVMVRNIETELIALMPEQAEYFTQNANELIAELEELDQDFREMMTTVNRTTIYHAGRFALHYLMHEYGISFVSAPMESEPDTALVARMITEIEADDIPVIFHEELVNPQIAEMIAGETDARPLLLHTVHNVSVDELAAGETYVSLMRHNLDVLRQALN
jgi:zinc transport system substrate-binding protein